MTSILALAQSAIASNAIETMSVLIVAILGVSALLAHKL